MKKLCILVVFITSAFLFINYKTNTKTAVSSSKSENWIQLFNGENLEGWTPKIRGYKVGENYNNTFRVENGILKVNYDEYKGKFNESYGHLFYNKEFSNYKFKMEYRFIGDQIADGAGWATRNSGVMVHGQTAESMELDQDFPISIEVQLLGGLGNGDRPTGNLCTPGTHVIMDNKLFKNHCISSNSQTYDGDQWVTVEILVMNDSIISHYINGEEVLSYTKPQIGGGNVSMDKEKFQSLEGTPLKKGTISLQSESHPVEFRNIEILEL
jgi:hypothetical protein